MQNLQNFTRFQKFRLDNLVDFEICCKTRIHLQRSVPIQPKTSNILPKLCRSAVVSPTGTRPPGSCSTGCRRTFRRSPGLFIYGIYDSRWSEGRFSGNEPIYLVLKYPLFNRILQIAGCRHDFENLTICTVRGYQLRNNDARVHCSGEVRLLPRERGRQPGNRGPSPPVLVEGLSATPAICYTFFASRNRV